MKTVPSFLSMNELVALCSIKTCIFCKEEHAAIRTCKEFAEMKELAKTEIGLFD